MLLVLAITEASWPALVAAALLMAVFVLVERRAVAPLVPWRVVRSRRLVAGNLLLLVAGMCVDGVLLVLALAAQESGMSPVQFGLTTAAMTVASVVGSFAGQAVVTRAGVRAVAVAGTALLAVGSIALTTLPPVVGLVVFGAGLGAAFVSAQIAAVSGAAADDAGLAAGIADTSFAVGGALGVAVLSTSATPAARSSSPRVSPFSAWSWARPCAPTARPSARRCHDLPLRVERVEQGTACPVRPVPRHGQVEDDATRAGRRAPPRGRPAAAPRRRRASPAPPHARGRARSRPASQAFMRRRVIASSAPNGSSRSSTGRPGRQVRSSARRWRMPPDSSCGHARSNPARPNSSNSARARASATARSMPAIRAPTSAFGSARRHGSRPSR